MVTGVRRKVVAGAFALGALVTLAGCGTPPWESPAAAGEDRPTAGAQESSLGPIGSSDTSGTGLVTTPRAESSSATSPDRVPTPAPSPAPEPQPVSEPEPEPARTPEPEPPVVTDDLATGSATRQLIAGSTVLAVDYWSTLARDEWTPSGVKALMLTVGAAGGSTVDLASLTVDVDRLTLGGWEAVPAELLTQPFIAEGGVSITLPATAGTSILVGDVGEDSYALRYTFVYTVTSPEYAGPVQAVATDTLVVTLADGGSAG